MPLFLLLIVIPSIILIMLLFTDYNLYSPYTVDFLIVLYTRILLFKWFDHLSRHLYVRSHPETLCAANVNREEPRRGARGTILIGETTDFAPGRCVWLPVPYLPLVPGYDVMHWKVADMMSCTGRWRYDVMHRMVADMMSCTGRWLIWCHALDRGSIWCHALVTANDVMSPWCQVANMWNTISFLTLGISGLVGGTKLIPN